MRKRIFLREFIGNKRMLVVFCLILTATFTVIGVQSVIANIKFGDIHNPDVELAGEIINDNIYEYYGDVTNIINVINKLDKENDIQVVKCVTRRQISCQQRNSLNSVTITLKGYDWNYLDEELSNYVASGRMVKKGNNEIVLGNYIAQILGLEVGDVLSDQTFNMGNVGNAQFPITLSKELSDYKFEKNKIVGILDKNVENLGYSMIVGNDDEQVPNTLELYFKNNKASTVYREMIDQIISNPECSIGAVNESYNENKSKVISLLINILITSVSVLSVVYLVITVLIKGITKKIGIMKAIGVSDKEIIYIFVGGFLVLEGVALVLGMSITNLMCYLLNSSYRKFSGISGDLYSVSIISILFMASVAVFISISLFLIIKYKTSKISPKVSMQQNN